MKNRNYCQDHTSLVESVEAVEQEAVNQRKENLIAVVLACVIFGLPILAGLITG